MPLEYKPKVKFFITTKAELATEKVNEWLEENEDAIDILDIKPFMSYTAIGEAQSSRDRAAYMIGCMVMYLENHEEDRTYIVSAPVDKNGDISFGMNFPEVEQ